MNEIDTAADRSRSSNDEPRDWFYRIGDRERGPLSFPQLKDLVASSGEMAGEIVVRHHSDGEWVPYASVDAATAQRLRSDRPVRPAKTDASNSPETVAGRTAAVAASQATGRWSALRGRFKLNRRIALGALAWVAANAVIWYVVDPNYRTERKYFQLLSDAATKAKEARDQGLSAEERGRIAAPFVEQAKPMIADLKKSANASQPIRQHLLWAAKDQLPKLFTASGKELKECDGIFQRHLYEAGRRMGIDISRPVTQVSLR